MGALRSWIATTVPVFCWNMYAPAGRILLSRAMLFPLLASPCCCCGGWVLGCGCRCAVAALLLCWLGCGWGGVVVVLLLSPPPMGSWLAGCPPYTPLSLLRSSLAPSAPGRHFPRWLRLLSVCSESARTASAAFARLLRSISVRCSRLYLYVFLASPDNPVVGWRH